MSADLVERVAHLDSRVPFEVGGSFFFDDIGRDVREDPADTIVHVLDEGRRWARWTVLAVDDDPLDGVPLLKCLKQVGIGRLIFAKTSYGALFQLTEDRSLFPNAVVIDAGLAGSAGIRLMKKIREHEDPDVRALPIIVTASDTSMHLFHRSCRYKIAAYLRKPIGISSMFEALIRADEGYRLALPWT